jgi:hypothetical protein
VKNRIDSVFKTKLSSRKKGLFPVIECQKSHAVYPCSEKGNCTTIAARVGWGADGTDC